MSQALDVEQVDLAELSRQLRETCGARVEGDFAGPTLLRDQVVLRLGCSELEAENLVDTLIAGGFIVRVAAPDGLVEWVIASGPFG